MCLELCYVFINTLMQITAFRSMQHIQCCHPQYFRCVCCIQINVGHSVQPLPVHQKCLLQKNRNFTGLCNVFEYIILRNSCVNIIIPSHLHSTDITNTRTTKHSALCLQISSVMAAVTRVTYATNSEAAFVSFCFSAGTKGHIIW